MNLSWAKILQLVTILGPKFKEVLPILIEIIQIIKGVVTPETPGFAPGPAMAPADFIKKLTAEGCDQVEVEKLMEVMK